MFFKKRGYLPYFYYFCHFCRFQHFPKHAVSYYAQAWGKYALMIALMKVKQDALIPAKKNSAQPSPQKEQQKGSAQEPQTEQSLMDRPASNLFSAQKKNTLICTISIIMLLLPVILLFVFLNRRKEEGIRF